MRRYSPLDHFLAQINKGLTTVFADLHGERQTPAAAVADVELTAADMSESAGYMRVNHSGEVCAQALYIGQLVFVRDATTRAMLQQAAQEETDHLAWTHQRLKALGSHRSYLNVIWYSNAFMIGMLASLAGDAWSLGFVEETERQVAAHLAGHLHRLPPADLKSRAVVAQMKVDEEQHGQAAADAGAKTLPTVIRWAMCCHGKVMTSLAHYI